MFENPHIIYIVAKMKHEELLAECRMAQLANAAKKIKKRKNHIDAGSYCLLQIL